MAKSFLISALFTACEDPQRKHKPGYRRLTADDPGLLRWIESSKKHFNEIILLIDEYDRFSDELRCRGVTPVAKEAKWDSGVSPYDFRWTAYAQHLSTLLARRDASEQDVVFLTDCTDVVTMNCPFNTYPISSKEWDGAAFVGDEPWKLRDNKWMAARLPRHTHLKDLHRFMDKHMLNAGMVGGRIRKMTEIAWGMDSALRNYGKRRLPHDTDMWIFNWLLRMMESKMNLRIVHGPMINSTMGTHGKDVPTAWFAHK